MGCFSAQKTEVAQVPKWEASQQAVGNIYGPMLEQALINPPSYPGQRVAPLSPLQGMGIEYAMGSLPGFQQRLNYATNPDISSVSGPIGREASRLWNETIAPSIGNTFAYQNSARSSSLRDALSRAGQGMTSQLAATLAPYELQNRAMNLQASTLPVQYGQQLAQLGGLPQAQGQAQIEAERQRWMEQQPILSSGATRALQFLGLPTTDTLATQQPAGFGYSAAQNILPAAFSAIIGSDERMKEHIEPVTDCLDKVRNIATYTYNYKGSDIECIGLIAQEIEKEFPEAITEQDGMKFVKLYELQSLIVGAINELRREVA